MNNNGADNNFCFYLKTNKIFNYEELVSNEGTSTFILQMNVIDLSNVSSSSIDMRVDVLDINEPPTFSSFSRSVDLTYANSGDIVGSVIFAKDPDFNDTLTYTIIGGNTGAPFDGILNTNDNTYQLITTRDDITTGGTGITANNPVVLTVRATDYFGLFSDSTVTISIIQSNRAPILSSVNFTVAEGVPSLNTLIGYVSGFDPDGNLLTWSVVSSSHSQFTMDSSGGLHQHSSNHIDYENGPSSIYLRVSASDGELSASASVVLEIIDINEPPYLMDLDLSIPETTSTDSTLKILQG
jgi:hypothetical protein